MTSSPAPKVSLAEALSMATGIALEDDAPAPARAGDGWEDVNVTASSPPRSTAPLGVAAVISLDASSWPPWLVALVAVFAALLCLLLCAVVATCVFIARRRKNPDSAIVPEDEVEWYYCVSGNARCGPLKVAEMRAMYAARQLPIDANFCTDGMNEWVALERLPKLCAAIGYAPGAKPAPTGAAAAPAKAPRPPPAIGKDGMPPLPKTAATTPTERALAKRVNELSTELAELKTPLRELSYTRGLQIVHGARPAGADAGYARAPLQPQLDARGVPDVSQRQLVHLPLGPEAPPRAGTRPLAAPAGVYKGVDGRWHGHDWTDSRGGHVVEHPMEALSMATRVDAGNPGALAALPPLKIAGNHSTPWEQHTTGDGKQYYFNRATGETTWDRSRTLYPN